MFVLSNWLMEFDNLGKCCYICHQRDFLPFQCDRCHQYYCLNHRTPESHNCPVTIKSNKPTKKKPPKTGYKCSVVGCKQTLLFANKCGRCGKQHCLLHRFPDTHNCILPRNTRRVKPNKPTRSLAGKIHQAWSRLTNK